LFLQSFTSGARGKNSHRYAHVRNPSKKLSQFLNARLSRGSECHFGLTQHEFLDPFAGCGLKSLRLQSGRASAATRPMEAQNFPDEECTPTAKDF
jgi:hypothetical protein